MPGTTPVGRAGTALAVGLTIAIVELTLITAYIHLTLGGTLFTLNALGYAALAAALALTAVPHPFVRRFAWLPRVGLGAYTVATIVGYIVIGPYFTLGWIAKGIELAILVLLAVDLIRLYGSPRALVRAAVDVPSPGRRAGAGRLIYPQPGIAALTFGCAAMTTGGATSASPSGPIRTRITRNFLRPRRARNGVLPDRLSVDGDRGTSPTTDDERERPRSRQAADKDLARSHPCPADSNS